MKPNQTLLGVQSPGEELVIRNFQRIKRAEETAVGLFDGTAGPVLRETHEVFLDAWSGEIDSGLSVHMSYRVGELTIEVDLPTPTGGYHPLTVLRWRPRFALELIAPAPRLMDNGAMPSREERARLAEASAELAEIRAINGKARILSEGEVRGWLVEHNRHFALLSERGIAGGKLRFRISHSEAATAAA